MRNPNAPHKIRYRKLQEERMKNRTKVQRAKVRKEIKEQLDLSRKLVRNKHLTLLEREMYKAVIELLCNILSFWNKGTKERLWVK